MSMIFGFKALLQIILLIGISLTSSAQPDLQDKGFQSQAKTEPVVQKTASESHDPLAITMMPGLDINTIIRNAAPGSVITFKPGDYILDTVKIVSKSRLTLKAESGTVTIQMNPPQVPYLHILDSTNIQISGLFFQYDKMLAGIGEDPLVLVKDSKGINLNYNEISGNAHTLLSLEHSSLIRLDNNLLWGICLYPLDLQGCNQVNIISNHVRTISDYPRFDKHRLTSDFLKIGGERLTTIHNHWQIVPFND